MNSELLKRKLELKVQRKYEKNRSVLALLIILIALGPLAIIATLIRILFF